LISLDNIGQVCIILRVAVFGVQFRRNTNAASLAFQRFYAMLLKHAIHSWRNRLVAIIQLLLPVIFAILACVFALTVPKSKDPPPLLLSLSNFDKPTVPFTSIGPKSVAQPLADSYSAVAEKHGNPVDAGGSNMDDYLLKMADHSLDDYNRLYTVAASANGNGSGSVTGHFNNFNLHSIAISVSLVDNAILNHAVPGQYRIETINHPLPRSVNTRTNDAADDAGTVAFIFSYTVFFGMAFLVGSFVVFIVNQRASNANHSQFVSGVDAVGYWLAAFVWDPFSFALPSGLVIVVVYVFQTDAYSEWPVLGYVDICLIVRLFEIFATAIICACLKLKAKQFADICPDVD